jgi:hypothetical protein
MAKPTGLHIRCYRRQPDLGQTFRGSSREPANRDIRVALRASTPPMLPLGHTCGLRPSRVLVTNKNWREPR